MTPDRTLASSRLVLRVRDHLVARTDRRLSVVARTDAHEGPVVAGGALFFTTVRRGARTDVKRLDLRSGRVDVVAAGTAAANGMALGVDGRLVVCEQGDLERPARIAALDPATGTFETITDGWRGRPLNSPNDVAVAADGTLWFTDPSYGWEQGFRPPPRAGDHVYRVDPGGRTVLVARGFGKPNGIALAPDERTLYVGDSERCLLWAFTVDRGRLTRRRLVARISPGPPDGLKVDARGRIHVSYANGVLVLDASGRRVGAIALPGAVNFAFGGDRLFITTDTAVWAAGRSST